MQHNDAEIRNLLARKRNEALRVIAQQYGDAIYWQARRMLASHEDAEDAVQETFLRIIAGIDAFRWDCALSTWIFRIAARESLRIIEKNNASATEELAAEALAEALPAMPNVEMGDELVLLFQQAVLRLPPRQRQVFTLRYYDELSYDEIALITDSKASAAKATYYLAKEKIKEYVLQAQ